MRAHPRFPIRAKSTPPEFTLKRNEMIIDFHHHYTPPELMGRRQDGTNVRLDEKWKSLLSFQC